MAEKFLSLSGMQTLWNKVKSVFATKTELNNKVDKVDSPSKRLERIYGISIKRKNWGTPYDWAVFSLVYGYGSYLNRYDFGLRAVSTSSEEPLKNMYVYGQNTTFGVVRNPSLRYRIMEDGKQEFLFTFENINPNKYIYGFLENYLSLGNLTSYFTIEILYELPDLTLYSNVPSSNFINKKTVKSQNNIGAVGSTSIPVYIDENGIVQKCTDVVASTINGVLPISKGGTGATTALAAEYALHTKTNTHLTADLADNLRIAFLSTAPSASNGVLAGYRKASQFWAYIQSKISSVLGLTKDVYGGKAASATSADSATKATQDGSGNNIVNTYATKEALNSANQNIAGLTSGVNSKLNKDGSNADSTTTYNVLNAAAGGGSLEISDDEEIILTYPTGFTAYKRTLAKFAEWIEDKVMPIINRKLNAWLGNEQEVVFNNVKVRKGVNSSEVEVATYYGIAQNYYNNTYIDEELSSLQASVDSKIGFNDVKNITNSGMATNAATSSLPITIFYAGTGGNISSIYKAYVANTQEPLFLTSGRCIYLVNTTASNVEISGLSKGNYTLNAGKAMTIIYYTGSSGTLWYTPDLDD